MKLYRIKAIVKRYIIGNWRDVLRISDSFYFPLIDIAIWGFTSRWVQATQSVDVGLILLSSLVLLQISNRSTSEVALNFLEELWSHNVVSLFSSPLILGEWIIAVMIIGLLKSISTILFGALAVWLLYHVNIFSIGLIFVPFGLSLLISGWAIGFFTTAFLAYIGQRVQSLTWMVQWLFVPFSAVFYPVSVLPAWGQCVAKLLPMTYIFEGLRSYVSTHIVPWDYLLISFLLNIVYIILSLLFFVYMFEKSRSNGLARLEQE